MVSSWPVRDSQGGERHPEGNSGVRSPIVRQKPRACRGRKESFGLGASEGLS